MKLLTLHTHGCPRASLRDCSSSFHFRTGFRLHLKQSVKVKHLTNQPPLYITYWQNTWSLQRTETPISCIHSWRTVNS